MKIHPAANLFPLLDGEEFEALVEDIRDNGQLVAILTDSGGRIIDGRNRWRACKSLGIKPKTKAWAGSDAVAFVVSMNLHRRHLTPSQRAMVAALIVKFGHLTRWKALDDAKERADGS